MGGAIATLRPLENVLLWPSQVPDQDLSALYGIRPRPNELWAVLDPPRTVTDGGVHLRAEGDGWGNRSIDTIEKLGEDWERWREKALRAIAVSKADPRSLKARKRARSVSEIAQYAYYKLHAALAAKDGESPGAGMELRPDAYTVVAAHESVPFVRGDRILGAPYSARRLKTLFGVSDVCLFGRDDPWEDIVPFVWNPLNSEWELTSNWVGVKLDQKGYSVEFHRKTYLNSGKVVVHGPEAESRCGDHVALHRDRTVHRPDDTKWFVCRMSKFDDSGTIFVRERDSDGVQRVLATFS